MPMGPGSAQGMSDMIGKLLGMIDQLTYGNTQEGFSIGEDEYPPGTAQVGMAPLSPGDVSGMASAGKGMVGRLRGLFGGGGKRAYEGAAPLAGSQGIPHTSPLPNQGPPAMPPSGGPSGGGFGDNMAGTIRGDVAMPPAKPGADFAAMDELRNPLSGAGNMPMSQEADMFVGRMLEGGYHPRDIMDMAQGAGFNPSEIAGVLGIPYP